MERGTCQICGGSYGTKKGVIAHHGYRRPHVGHQTRSCEGALHVPYEVSCERLRKHIADVARLNEVLYASIEYLSWGVSPVMAHDYRRDIKGRLVPPVYRSPADRDFYIVLQNRLGSMGSDYRTTRGYIASQRKRAAAWPVVA